jgi:two-component system phosphate regulon sensor histidine kinase PhoR
LTRFHSRAFAAALTAQVAVLVAATWLVAAGWRDDARAATERRLADQAVLVAEILSRTSAQTPDASLDADADRLAQSLTGRVTLVAPDGRVVGDSALDGAALAATPALGDRPEIRQARTNRLGVAADEALLYAAVPTNHPRIGFVRVALPPPDPGPIRRQTAVLALGALLLGLPAALVVAWGVGALTQRRVAAIAAAAHRYGEGDLTRTAVDYGSDALGDVARVFDAVVQQLGRRLGDLARDQARMEAVLSGMVEGVLVVDRQGRLQLVNRAAQAMLRVEAGTVGRPYLEVIRHPDIAAQLTSALRGEAVDSRELVLARDPERTFVARAASPCSTSSGSSSPSTSLHGLQAGRSLGGRTAAARRSSS